MNGQEHSNGASIHRGLLSPSRNHIDPGLEQIAGDSAFCRLNLFVILGKESFPDDSLVATEKLPRYLRERHAISRAYRLIPAPMT